MHQTSKDQLLIVRIEGMHCHRCQEKIKKFLQFVPGVHECEVDFPSAQASIIFDPAAVKIGELIDAITDLGYKTAGFTTQAMEP
ncbi:MAG: heavy metal-associated domain-containing protein [Tepidisphaeraceae bacterium]|jgi:copper chaperone CopZ